MKQEVGSETDDECEFWAADGRFHRVTGPQEISTPMLDYWINDLRVHREGEK